MAIDFNSETLQTSNKGELLTFVTLDRRNDLINNYSNWYKERISNGSAIANKEHTLRSSMLSLFNELEHALKRNIKDKEVFTNLKNFVHNIGTVEPKEILHAYDLMSSFLDDINLTKIDTKRKINSLMVEDENADKGL